MIQPGCFWRLAYNIALPQDSQEPTFLRGAADKVLTGFRHAGYKFLSMVLMLFISLKYTMPERLLSTMGTIQETPQPGQIIHDNPGVRTTGFSFWSMAPGVLLLALS